MTRLISIAIILSGYALAPLSTWIEFEPYGATPLIEYTKNTMFIQFLSLSIHEEEISIKHGHTNEKVHTNRFWQLSKWYSQSGQGSLNNSGLSFSRIAAINRASVPKKSSLSFSTGKPGRARVSQVQTGQEKSFLFIAFHLRSLP